jgi:hypothetical protein
VGTWLSEAYLLAGRLEEARQRAAQAVDLASQHQQRGIQAWALWLLGESIACQATPEVEAATGHYRQALALAEELGMRPLQAHCHLGLGILYQSRLIHGDRAPASHGDDLLASPSRGGIGKGGIIYSVIRTEGEERGSTQDNHKPKTPPARLITTLKYRHR